MRKVLIEEKGERLINPAQVSEIWNEESEPGFCYMRCAGVLHKVAAEAEDLLHYLNGVDGTFAGKRKNSKQRRLILK